VEDLVPSMGFPEMLLSGSLFFLLVESLMGRVTLTSLPFRCL